MQTDQDDQTLDQNTTQAIKGANFDPDALRDKYRLERDKRLREQGNDQYIDISGVYKHF